MDHPLLKLTQEQFNKLPLCQEMTHEEFITLTLDEEVIYTGLLSKKILEEFKEFP